MPINKSPGRKTDHSFPTDVIPLPDSCVQTNFDESYGRWRFLRIAENIDPLTKQNPRIEIYQDWHTEFFFSELHLR